MAMTGAGGLEGVVVAETRLSHVDGQGGRLWVAGKPLDGWAGQSTEAVVASLWGLAHGVEAGTRPPPDAEGMVALLGQARMRAFEALQPCFDRWQQGEVPADAMDALMMAVAWCGSAAGSDGAWWEEAASMAATVAVAAAGWQRCQAGLAPRAPQQELSHAADVLAMASIQAEVGDATVAGLDAYLSTVLDHGMNASTFAARVVASTGGDARGAVLAGLAALKGPLHGGAPGPVLDMLDAVGTPERALGWLEAELDAGRRVMGMGHRIYRVRDPRAAALEGALERLEEQGAGRSDVGRLPLARAVEQAAEGVLAARYPQRSLRANVEFYTAVLLDAVGVDRRAFTATFAVGRVFGWLAHVREQRQTGRLIRPSSRYVGPGAATLDAAADAQPVA